MTQIKILFFAFMALLQFFGASQYADYQIQHWGYNILGYISAVIVILIPDKGE